MDTAVCPLCGERMPAGLRRCSTCGAQLSSEPAREVRKIVSALFCDLVGSTAMGERLDAETFREVMARYYAVMRRAIERHGGHVEKFIGDAIVGVFGVPRLEEDDAARAVAAGLEMRRRIDDLNIELERDWGARLEIRIAVNTGESVVESGEPRELGVLGDVMNVGARLQTAAAPGEILLGEQTYALVRNSVDALSVGPLSLKGKRAPVSAWRLVELTAARPRPEEFDSPLVGRANELEELAENLALVRDEGTGRLVSVLGPAGVGKSRLLHEFDSKTRDSATLLQGQCLPYGDGITFWPIAQVIREACGITLDEPAESSRAKIAERLPAGEDRFVLCDRVAAVLGLAEAASGVTDTFWAIRKFLEAVAQPRPLVLAFEDVHWADRTFLDLVTDLATRPLRAPILVLCLSRPDFLEIGRDWLRLEHSVVMQLDLLGVDDSRLLIDNLLGGRPLREDVSRHLAETSAGNPLFLEELVRMLVEDGVLREEGRRWVAAADLSTIRVPPTLWALLAARIDRLDADERIVLGAASVVGREFAPAAVAELVPVGVRNDVAPRLDALVDRGFVRSGGGDAFRFHHILIRDVAYSLIPKRIRAELHERHGAWLERRASERLPEIEEIVGYHYEQAVRLREELAPATAHTRALRTRAGELLGSSGRHAAGRGDLHGAVKLLRRALALVPDESPVTQSLRLDLGVSLLEAGHGDEATLELTRAIELARARRDERVEAYARIERSGLRVDMDPQLGWQMLKEEAEQARTGFAVAGDDLGLAKAWRGLGIVDAVAWRLGVAVDELEQARTAARRTRDARDEARVTNMIFYCLVVGPAPVRAAILRCEKLIEESGRHRSVEAFGLAALANLQAMITDFDNARGLVARSDAMFEELGQTRRRIEAAFRAAEAAMLADDPTAAHIRLARVYRSVFPTNETGYLASLAAAWAEALDALGRVKDAERLTAVCRRLAGPDDVDSQVRWRQIRARIAVRRGDVETAAALAREAAQKAAPTDALNMRAATLLDFAQIARSAGEVEAAGGYAREARRLYVQKGNLVGERRARDLAPEPVRRRAAVDEPREVRA